MDLNSKMGVRWSLANQEFKDATTSQPVKEEMPWVVGCLDKGALVVAPPNYETIQEHISTLRVMYGGAFLIHRSEPLCEWRYLVTLSPEYNKYMLLIPSKNDVIQTIYDSKHIGYTAGYKTAVQELGRMLGTQFIDVNV